MKQVKQATFSVELVEIKKIQVNTEKDAFIEGSLGELVEVSFHDDILLEVRGTKGVLRLDITREKLLPALRGGKQ